MHFFQNYVPFSTLTFYPLSGAPHPSVGTCMQCSCYVTAVQIFENSVEKGKMACNEQFLLFFTVFHSFG